MRRRISAVAAVALVLVFTPAVAGSSPALSGHPKIATTAAEWASFSPAERAAMMQYEWDLLQTSLANGTADIHQVDQARSGALVQSDGIDVVTTTYDYNCPIQWIDQIGGAWFRGGGFTDASANAYYIAASRVGLKGQFLRDGVLSGNWYNEKYGDSHAESWSGWSWRGMWETIHWTNKGWHTIKMTSSSYLLGPDAYCYVSITR